MRDHNLTPPKKKLPPLVKVKLASVVLAAVLADRMTEKDAGRVLRDATGTQWSLLTCMQYLSGKEALSAIAALPADWAEDGMTREALEHATKVAAFAVAKRLNGLGAQLGAMSMMAATPGEGGITVGLGHSGGQTALAIGWSKRLTERTSIAVGAAFGGGNKAVIGVGLRIGGR